MQLLEIFCLSDNFVKSFKKKLVGRRGKLSEAEYITLGIYKHLKGFSNNKKFYEFVKCYLGGEFKNIPSYQQYNCGFKSVLPHVLILTKIICELNKKRNTKYYFVDSTPIPVCSFAHRYNVKIDFGLGKTGKNMNGWFYGFKLHMIINHDMEIVSIKLTNGATSDIVALDENFINGIEGVLFGDKGYISEKKAIQLSRKGVTLVTKQRKNMKKKKISTGIECFLKMNRKRIETVFGKIKIHLGAINRFARSFLGFMTSLFFSILTYSIQQKSVFTALARLY